jgi:hypothetical protein
MRELLALFYALLVLSTNAFAQSNGSAASLWDHNGSVVYLVAQGSLREFYYKEPRPGMVEAGVRPGSLLFRGKIANGEYVGTAIIFDPRCGQFSYPVRGPILDNDDRIVVAGEAPRVSVKCRVQGSFMEVLEFRLRNANKTGRSLAAEDTTLPPRQFEERAATSRPLRPQDRAAAPVLTASEVALREEHAPRERMAAASDRASAPLAAPEIPPPTPVLTAEIERTRAAWERAAAAAEAAGVAEVSARGAVAETKAVRHAAQERMPESREQLEAAQLENLEARSWQNLVLATISLTLGLLVVAIMFLFVKLRRLQSSLPTENALAVVATNTLLNSGDARDCGVQTIRRAGHYGDEHPMTLSGAGLGVSVARARAR